MNLLKKYKETAAAVVPVPTNAAVSIQRIGLLVYREKHILAVQFTTARKGRSRGDGFMLNMA